jgi:hypothetical protein
MLNLLKHKLVMAFSSKNIQIDRVIEEPLKAPLPTVTPTLDLSKGEIELLLLLIKDSSFKGEHVETIYSLVYKLQQYYTKSNR